MGWNTAVLTKVILSGQIVFRLRLSLGPAEEAGYEGSTVNSVVELENNCRKYNEPLDCII